MNGRCICWNRERGNVASRDRNAATVCLSVFLGFFRSLFFFRPISQSSLYQPATMARLRLELKGLLLLALLSLAGSIHAWTDLNVKMQLEKRALLGGTACTLAAKYGYVRDPIGKNTSFRTNFTRKTTASLSLMVDIRRPFWQFLPGWNRGPFPALLPTGWARQSSFLSPLIISLQLFVDMLTK